MRMRFNKRDITLYRVDNHHKDGDENYYEGRRRPPSNLRLKGDFLERRNSISLEYSADFLRYLNLNYLLTNKNIKKYENKKNLKILNVPPLSKIHIWKKSIFMINNSKSGVTPFIGPLSALHHHISTT